MVSSIPYTRKSEVDLARGLESAIRPYGIIPGRYVRGRAGNTTPLESYGPGRARPSP